MALNKPGGVLSLTSYVDVPSGPQKSDFIYTNFLPNFSPISIPFLKERHPILNKLGAFNNNLPKIHPIYVILAPLSLMNPSHCCTKFCKNTPQKAGTYMYTMSMWDPPAINLVQSVISLGDGPSNWGFKPSCSLVTCQYYNILIRIFWLQVILIILFASKCILFGQNSFYTYIILQHPFFGHTTNSQFLKQWEKITIWEIHKHLLL